MSYDLRTDSAARTHRRIRGTRKEKNMDVVDDIYYNKQRRVIYFHCRSKQETLHVICVTDKAYNLLTLLGKHKWMSLVMKRYE